MKYLGVSPKKMYKMHTKTPLTLMNKIKQELNKELSYVPGEKDTILPRHQFFSTWLWILCNPMNSIKIPECYFTIIDKLILKFIYRSKTQNSQHSIEEEFSGRIDTTWPQDLLSSSSHQGSVVLLKVDKFNRATE